MARSKPILKIGGDSSGAKRAVRDVKDELSALERQKAEARVQIQTEAAQARLKILSERLERLNKQEASPRVQIARGTVLAQIERIEEKLRGLDGKNVTVDVDVKRGAAERVGSKLNSIVSSAGSRALSAFGNIGVNPLKAFSSVLAVLPPQVLAVAAAIGAALLPLLIPLAASFTAAAAGAVLLGGALGLALIAPFGLVAVAVGKVVKIFQALKQEQQQHATLASQRQAAAEQEAAAQRTLADAYRNLREQADAARKAQEDASRAVPRDQLSVDQGRLGQQQARLNRQKAERELRDGLGAAGGNTNDLFRKFTDVDVRTDPASIRSLLAKSGARAGSSLDVQQLVLNVKQAKLNERDATLTLSDAVHKLNEDRQTEADFLDHGISAYKPYEDALLQVKRAQDNVRRATETATDAQSAQGDAIEKLSPGERRLAARLKTIGDRVSRAFGPAISDVVNGIVHAMSRISEVLGDRGVRRGIRDLGSALGGAFRSIGKDLSNPRFRRFFRDVLEDGAKMVPDITRLFRVIARTMRDLAEATLPKVVGGISKVTKSIGRFEKEHGGAKRLGKAVDSVVGSFKDWSKLIGGVGLILTAFFRAGKRQGDRMTGSIGDAAIKLGEFLNTEKGQEKLIRFFRTVRRLAADLSESLASIAKSLAAIAKSSKGAADTVGGVSTVAGVLSALGSPVKAPVDLIRGKPGKAVKDLSPAWNVIQRIIRGHALGGFVNGPGGFGDNMLMPVEGGEFVIRRAIVDAVGVPALASLNATGAMPATAMASSGGGGRSGVHVENLHVHAPAGRNVDARALGPLIDREFRARGWG